MEKDDRSDVEFHASNGWVQKFMNRHGLSVRRKTTQSQKDPECLLDKLVNFVLQVRRLRNPGFECDPFQFSRCQCC